MPMPTGQGKVDGCSSSIVSYDLSSGADPEVADATDRLVDSSKIRKAVEAMYTAFLPKGASPWVYLRYVRGLVIFHQAE